MAVRSGAGTGVIVSLVIFIIASASLLVLTIAFHAGQSDALAQKAAAEDALERYVLPQQRNQDIFQRYEGMATERRESVAQFLHNRLETLTRYVDGNPGASLEAVQARFAGMGVEPDGVVSETMRRMRTELQRSKEEMENLNAVRQQLQSEIEQMRASMDNLRDSHSRELASVQDQIAGYRQAADNYRGELDDAKLAMNESVDRLQDQYETRINELVQENDDFSRQVVALQTRVEELQQRLSSDRLRAQDPATLVDGRIIGVSGAADTVFIDRGRKHRVVQGMTFEVYDDAAAIRPDASGQLPRGKASIQVIRVGDETSTGKIIRSVAGRPVIQDNVIANAVYDPNYQFKFLVHGRFDVDGDSRATATEADYIRSMIREWGGEVVEGDEIPGDLDFLVLGVPPDRVMQPRDDASVHEIDAWLRKRREFDQYQRLLDDATRAQIPVLNHNRFFVLTGHVPR